MTAARSRVCLLGFIPASALIIALGPPGAQGATEPDESSDPAAIIEAIDAEGITDLDFMDYVYEGMELSLGETGTITLAYLQSCRVELIKGGTVKIGASKSKVSSPMPIEVSKIDCDGGGIVATDRQSEDVAGYAFRNPPPGGEVPVRVYSTSPVFAFREPVGELVIEPEEPGLAKSLAFPVEGTRLDLAEHKVRLQPGAIYRAKAGDRSVLFQISRNARGPGRTVLERLVGF